MPSVTSTTHLLGFRSPVVNRDAVVLPVMVHGALHGLAATPALWREIVGELCTALGVVNPASAPRSASAFRRRVSPEVEARYRAVHAQCVQTGCTATAACRGHGVNYSAFQKWRSRHVRAMRDPARPITKPSGKIL